jgi:hypothetical protein
MHSSHYGAMNHVLRFSAKHRACRLSCIIVSRNVADMWNAKLSLNPRDSRIAWIFGSITMVALSSLYGCALFQKSPAPVNPPEMNVLTTPFIGTPLTGPTTTASPSFGITDAMQIDLDWSVLQQFPGEELLPLDAQSRLTSAPLASGPVLTVGQSTRLIRFGGGGFASAFAGRMQSGVLGLTVHAKHQSGLIAPGTTIRFDCVLPSLPDKGIRSITLWVGHVLTTATSSPTIQPTEGTMAISVQGLVTTAPETAFLDKIPLEKGEQFAILMPCTFDGTPWRALVAQITIRRITDDAKGAKLVESLRDELSAASAAARAGVTAPSPGNQPELQSALGALTRNEELRPPLLFLATNTGAKIASDFILVADESNLGLMRDHVVTRLASQPNPSRPGDLGWILDRSALLIMIGQATKNTLPPEMASVLVLHAGEVGRHPDSLEDIVKSISNSADLKLRLIGENFIALEDSSPSARVRAYDWLKMQGKAPAEFDPMGDRKSRRDAIDKAFGPSGGAQ